MVRVFAHILHVVNPLSYFSFQPVLHDWCNKGCGMVHIKEPLLLIGKSSLCGGSRFPFSLSEWSLTICLTPYNRKYNVLSASLNKKHFLPSFDLQWVEVGSDSPPRRARGRPPRGDAEPPHPGDLRPALVTLRPIPGQRRQRQPAQPVGQSPGALRPAPVLLHSAPGSRQGKSLL